MFKRVIIMVYIIVLFVGCSKGNSELSINMNTQPSRQELSSSESKESSSVSIIMIKVPVPNQGITFPIGIFDKGRATINYVYEVGETQVTWELWNRVYDWATSIKRGSDRYFFQNSGRQGGDINWHSNFGFGTDQHPVTRVSWRDSMVWCNAATEWYNAMNGFSLVPVYRYNDDIVRDSRDRNAIACDNVVVTANNGFRLPTSEEWELVARWRNDEINTVEGYSNPWFTRGDSASGAIASISNSLATGSVAWYRYNSSDGTNPVAKKQSNDLGLYDMSGNVWEFLFARCGSNRLQRGGGWYDISNLRIGVERSDFPDNVSSNSGFRLFRIP